MPWCRERGLAEEDAVHLPGGGSGSQEMDAAKKTSVLIVADEVSMAQALSDSLEERGFETLVAPSVEAAWEVLWHTNPDLMLLDLALPGGEDAGFSFAEELREADFRQPILFLSAQESPNTVRPREKGFDYLVKPFGMAELVTRLQALHGQGKVKPRAVRWGGLELLTEARQLRHEGVLVQLTAKEYEILELFVLNPERIFSREEVIEQVWGDRYETPPSLVDVYIKNLRGKLMDKVIETVNGLGYRFSA